MGLLEEQLHDALLHRFGTKLMQGRQAVEFEPGDTLLRSEGHLFHLANIQVDPLGTKPATPIAKFPTLRCLRP